MPHHFEEPRHVVLRLARAIGPGKAHRGQIVFEPHQDLLPSGLGKVERGVRSYFGFACADENSVVFEARRLGVHCPGRASERAPGARQSCLLAGCDDFVGARDGLEQRRIRSGVVKPCKQRVVAGARLVFLDAPRLEVERRDLSAHFLTSKIVASFLFSIMSTTRQSAHICNRLSAPSPANMEWPESLPSMLSTIWRVPKGLPQRTQLNGAASFSTTSCFACAVSSRRGASVIASSGQVFWHSPHCTQLRSMNFSIGRSRPSTRADSGHAPTQAMHRVQVCLSTRTWPYGAPAPSAIVSCGLGANLARCSIANSSVARFSAARL